MGRPVIAADHGGPRETVVAGETGWLVPPGDADGLAAAMAAGDRRWARSGARAMGAGRRATARARLYSVEAMCEATLDGLRRGAGGALVSRKPREIAKILVIKLGGARRFRPGAGGDGAHPRRPIPKAHITLLTTPPFEALATRQPLLQRRGDRRRGRRASATGSALIRRLRRAHYDRVYDLQTSSRSNLIFQPAAAVRAAVVGHRLRLRRCRTATATAARCTRWSGRPTS